MVAFAEFHRLDLGGVIAIDGKALRGAYERGRSATPMHMVNVFATEARMALASCKAPGRNEAAGALEVLGMLCLKRRTVTADALHCHRKFAAAVLERGNARAHVISISLQRRKYEKNHLTLKKILLNYRILM